MNDEAAVIAVFESYTEDFKKLDPGILVDYYDYPSTLTDNEQTILMFHPIVGYFVFGSIVKKFKKENYKCSKLDVITAKQLSKNLALVSGKATRYDKDKNPYFEFGYTYTFRKKDNKWKIIYGVIHDQDTYLTLPYSKS